MNRVFAPLPGGSYANSACKHCGMVERRDTAACLSRLLLPGWCSCTALSARAYASNGTTAQ